MTSNVSTSSETDAAQLAEAVFRSLSREHSLRPTWGAVKTILFGAITFGILPLYAWSKTFRTSATVERQQLWHLAEWLRLNSGQPDAARLTVLAARVGYRPLLWICSVICAAAVAVVFAYQAQMHGFDFRDLRASTYSLGHIHSSHLPYSVARKLFITWNVGLCFAYFLQWIHLQLHHAEVRRFVGAFNELTWRQQIRPVPVRPITMGFRPIWAVGAIVMVSFGAIWGIPMALAGASQARWPRESRSIRAGLADALRQMLMLQEPVMRIPRAAKLGDFCSNDFCRGRVPPQARFCPRCGLVVPEVAGVDKVA